MNKFIFLGQLLIAYTIVDALKLGMYKLDKIKSKKHSTYTRTDIEEIKNNIEITDEQVMAFKNRLEEVFDEEDLYNLYNNLQSLKIKRKNIMLSDGLYNIRTNKIEYRKESAINHELFHMASRSHNQKLISGFHQGIIGTGFNEGYTEVMTKRYFPDNDFHFCDVYIKERKICESIEKVVGQEKLEKLYLNADLKGLIEELSKYIDKKRVYELLFRMDSFILYESRTNLNKIKEILRLIGKRKFDNEDDLADYNYHVDCIKNELEEEIIEIYSNSKEKIKSIYNDFKDLSTNLKNNNTIKN